MGGTSLPGPLDPPLGVTKNIAVLPLTYAVFTM